MTSTLKDIIHDALLDMGELQLGTATGGTTTTLVDSGLKGRDDDWTGGTLFIDDDAGGAGAAPEGEMAEIDDYARTTGTITFTVGKITVAPAAGDIYAVASKRYALDTMRMLVNRGLAMIGDVPAVDTSLTTAAGTLEYTIPAAARGNDVIKDVYMPQSTSSTDREIERHVGWYTLPDHKLIFREQPPTGQTINILYSAKHTPIWLYSDTISPFLNHELAVAATVYQAYRWARRRIKGISADWKDMVDQARLDYDDAHKRWRKQFLLPGPPFKSILTKESDNFMGRSNKYGPWDPS